MNERPVSGSAAVALNVSFWVMAAEGKAAALAQLWTSTTSAKLNALSAGPVGKTRRGEKLGPCERQQSFHRSPSTKGVKRPEMDAPLPPSCRGS